jgi:hypothetical protein
MSQSYTRRMWPSKKKDYVKPTLETVVRTSKILVLDDQEFPQQTIFQRDGYNFERWPDVQNLSQLSDGRFQIILLDIQGVGLNESPTRQGLGILESIKNSNPGQAVILYSAQPQRLISHPSLSLADVVLDKSSEYVDYKKHVDQLLMSQANPGYFIAAMNRSLGENAILVPKAVSMAIKSLDKGETKHFGRYLTELLPDIRQVEQIITIISLGIKTVELFAK